MLELDPYKVDRWLMLRNLAREPHAVYRIYHDDGRLLYVGVTWDPEQRLKQHRGWVRQYWATTWYALAWYDDKASAYAAEATAIRTEAPLSNVGSGGQSRLVKMPGPECRLFTVNPVTHPEYGGQSTYRNPLAWLPSHLQHLQLPQW